MSETNPVWDGKSVDSLTLRMVAAVGVISEAYVMVDAMQKRYGDPDNLLSGLSLEMRGSWLRMRAALQKWSEAMADA